MAEPDTATVVTIATTGQSFRCPKDELILDAGLEAGIALPHNCRGGACGTCKSQILEGEVDHGWVMSFAISDEEKAALRKATYPATRAAYVERAGEEGEKLIELYEKEYEALSN